MIFKVKQRQTHQIQCQQHYARRLNDANEITFTKSKKKKKKKILKKTDDYPTRAEEKTIEKGATQK